MFILNLIQFIFLFKFIIKGSKRQRRETQNLHDYVVFGTTGAENEVVDSNTTAEIYWRRVAYIPVIDSVVRNLKHRFSKESLLMACSVECFIKMDFVESSYFINHYKVNITFLNNIFFLINYKFMVILIVLGCFNDRYSCSKIRNDCSKKLHDHYKTGF